ncbi:MAG TPA: selenoneine synthase SenA [Vicinamibacteria bacterium]|nr:selenoneine synthase SenA [Vicinamibacteria bacterium]
MGLAALGEKHHRLSSATLDHLVRDARHRTLDLVQDLADRDLELPKLDIVNPIRWELGHVAHFFEVFFLDLLGKHERLLPGADEMYDSFKVAHEDRWSLPLPDRDGTLAYMNRVLELVLERLGEAEPGPAATYLALLGTLHEDMHGEALTYTRQTLGYPRPVFEASPVPAGGPCPGEVEIPGGNYRLGASPEAPFVFDNEKWSHHVELAPYRIARAPVTNEEFAAFVDEGGFLERRFWSYEGWVWRSATDLRCPRYWVRSESGWLERDFDRYAPLAPFKPVVHVSWFEAEAYCNWAGRRLPSEAEWELAASSMEKHPFPWGVEPPTPERANLDSHHLGTVDVGAFPASDSAFGCRQMIGNVWEWTASAFYPFPGFVVDFPYREYSAPWFGYHKVLRGGAWATRSRLISNTYRNFFLPHRGDVLAGFRTCARRAQ